MITTAGSWKLQRLEYEPRQQLPANRGSLDRGLLPRVQTSLPTHTLPGNRNRNPPGPLITSHPPPHPSRAAGVPDSTENPTFSTTEAGRSGPAGIAKLEIFKALCGPVHGEQPKSGQNVMQSLPSFFPPPKISRS